MNDLYLLQKRQDLRKAIYYFSRASEKRYLTSYKEICRIFGVQSIGDLRIHQIEAAMEHIEFMQTGILWFPQEVEYKHA